METFDERSQVDSRQRATTLTSQNLARRSTELERAGAIMAEEMNRALRQRFEAIRRAELTRLEPKLSALSLEARTRLDEITRLIVEKLLLTPTEQLKSVSNGTMGVRYAGALNRLFRLALDDKIESRLDEGL